ncbi:MAG TPA: peptidase S8, partial [Candidatus Dormibacteraeota bacterium]
MKAVLRRVLRRASVAAVAALLFSATGATTAGAGATSQHTPSCGPAQAGSARCHAILARPDARPSFVGTSPAGYNPPDLQLAYNLPSATAGTGQTVAIVDAYNDPNAESDLGVYRSQFGLPACTTANG